MHAENGLEMKSKRNAVAAERLKRPKIKVEKEVVEITAGNADTFSTTPTVSYLLPSSKKMPIINQKISSPIKNKIAHRAKPILVKQPTKPMPNSTTTSTNIIVSKMKNGNLKKGHNFQGMNSIRVTQKQLLEMAQKAESNSKNKLTATPFSLPTMITLITTSVANTGNVKQNLSFNHFNNAPNNAKIPSASMKFVQCPNQKNMKLILRPTGKERQAVRISVSSPSFVNSRFPSTSVSLQSNSGSVNITNSSPSSSITQNVKLTQQQIQAEALRKLTEQLSAVSKRPIKIVHQSPLTDADNVSAGTHVINIGQGGELTLKMANKSTPDASDFTQSFDLNSHSGINVKPVIVNSDKSSTSLSNTIGKKVIMVPGFPINPSNIIKPPTSKTNHASTSRNKVNFSVPVKDEIVISKSVLHTSTLPSVSIENGNLIPLNHGIVKPKVGGMLLYKYDKCFVMTHVIECPLNRCCLSDLFFSAM